MSAISSCVLLVLFCLVLPMSDAAPTAVSQPLPVILLHGIFSGPETLILLEEYIQESLPGIKVYNIDAYNDLLSTTNMWTQLDGIRAKMIKIFEAHPEGVNMICYSQGGLTCRAVLQTTPNHNVKTFISLSSPQAGQFGETDFLAWLVPNYATENIYKVFYTLLSQKTLSIANYWRDPHHEDLYLEKNSYLPSLNGYPLNSSKYLSYRTNFIRLERLVMIGGPEDGVITPWQSSYFEFFDENEVVVNYNLQEYYLKDTFGLRTLDEDGKTQIHVVPGVEHLHWPTNYHVFTNYILPYL